MNAGKIFGVIAVVASLSFTTGFGDKDPLHKKKYDALATEIKDGKPSAKKPAEDKIDFKNGKVYSSYIYDKTDGGFSDVKYEITKDSVFTSEGEEMHYYEVVAITTNDKKETLNMTYKISGYDIEASYKIIKKEVVKKQFSSTGKEKVKEKKKKDKE